MKTIGETLRSFRVMKKISYSALEDKTKIKKEFIKLIEEEKWKELPEYPVVLGFIKNISSCIGLNPETSAALLRRDYNFKNEDNFVSLSIKDKLKWNPKLTLFLGLALVIVAIGSYLIIQYISFISPPGLVVTAPLNGQIVSEGLLTVSGKSDQDVVIKVNNQPAQTDSEGNFITQLVVDSSVDRIIITAISRSQKETTRTINIQVE